MCGIRSCTQQEACYAAALYPWLVPSLYESISPTDLKISFRQSLHPCSSPPLHQCNPNYTPFIHPCFQFICPCDIQNCILPFVAVFQFSPLLPPSTYSTLSPLLLYIHPVHCSFFYVVRTTLDSFILWSM